MRSSALLRVLMLAVGVPCVAPDLISSVSAPNSASAQKTQRPTPGSLKEKLAGTKWVNSNNVSFEWTTDGRFLHKGVEREWKVLDGNRVQIVFAPDHKDT